jgi:beta-lactamase superfamily II metal-dependent hydrolase
MCAGSSVRHDAALPDLKATIAAKALIQRAGKPVDTFSLGEVPFTALAPFALSGNVNDNSLVIRMDCRPSSFLFTGDAEFGAERLLVSSQLDLDIDVFKLGQPRLRHLARVPRPWRRRTPRGLRRSAASTSQIP